MAEENMNLEAEVDTVEEVAPVKEAKASKNKVVAKRPNFFVRAWKALKKFLYDTKGELRKVVWTPKRELVKNSKIVIVTVVVVGVLIAAIDLGSSWIINSIAGLIG